MPPQAGDFMGVFEGVPYVIEVKSSSKHSSMLSVPKSYIRASQIVGARLWIRAGGAGFFIFHGISGGGIFEVWNSADVVNWVLEGTKLIPESRVLLAKGRRDFEIKLLERLQWRQ